MVVTITNGPAYGVSWNKTGGGAVGVRPAGQPLTNIAVTSPTNGATTAAVTQASGLAPWSGVRRCNLWDDGNVTAYYGDRCFTNTDVTNMGQVMVQIPKFYYNMQYDAGTTTYYWFITLDPTCEVNIGAGAQLVQIHPAFNRGGSTLWDGTDRDCIYLGAFEASLNSDDSKLESKANVTPKDNWPLTSFRTAARLRKGSPGDITNANYWELQDCLATSAVQMLYLVEYGNLNSQLVISNGLTQNAVAAVSKTGWTSASGPTGSSSLGNATGQVQVSGADWAMSYRGIENLFGNTMTILDGINIKDPYLPWVANHDFVSTNVTGHPYINAGVTMPGAFGNIQDISLATTYGFLPVTGGGTATQYLCDAQYGASASSYIRTAAFGGKYTSATGAGVFCLYGLYVPGDTIAAYGSRLMYMGPNI